MTVGSMEALGALAPGAVIKVTSNRTENEWVRAEDGLWTRGEVSLPASMFTGLVAGGRVVDQAGATPQPGAMYRSRQGQYLYLVYQVQEQSVSLMRFRTSGVLSAEVIYTLLDMRSLTRVPEGERPQWYTPVWAAVSSRQRALERTTTAWQTVATSLEEAQAQVTTLEQAQRNRSGVVNVVVTGTSQVPTEKADGHVPAAAQVDSVLARWRASLTLETRGQGCLCAQVNRAWVMQQLGIDPNQPTGTFEYSVDCGRHDT